VNGIFILSIFISSGINNLRRNVLILNLEVNEVSLDVKLPWEEKKSRTGLTPARRAALV